MAFLAELLAVYPTQTILLIVDNYSSHTAHVVDDWLRDHPRLQLHLLPKYCSHLNPVESIWLRMKNEIAANRLFGSIKIVLQTVDTFFVRMTPEQALTWAAPRFGGDYRRSESCRHLHYVALQAPLIPSCVQGTSINRSQKPYMSQQRYCAH